MNLKSTPKTVSKSQESVFDFLTNVENYKQLMPEKLEHFEILGEKIFLFQLKGMPEIKLEEKERHPYDKIVMGALEGKLQFTLTAEIEAVSDAESKVQFFFNGDFNPMMAMMVKKPIGKFINTLAEKLETI